jgi:cytochrome c oxidase subunit 4
MAGKKLDGGDQHISLKMYWGILFTLLGFTVLTVAASRVNFGEMNTVIALTIASIKAGLVLAYFMHLRYDDKIYLVGFSIAIFLVILLFLVAYIDWHTTVFFKDVVS